MACIEKIKSLFAKPPPLKKSKLVRNISKIENGIEEPMESEEIQSS